MEAEQEFFSCVNEDFETELCKALEDEAAAQFHEECGDR